MILAQTQIVGSVEDYHPLTLTVVNRTELEPLWGQLIRDHHYLGFGKMIGQSVKYLVWADDTPLAALSFNRATLRVGVRDDYIGWNEDGRKQFLDNVICNHRFLIFPWVRVQNLASHVLAKSLNQIQADWEEMYGHRPKLVETFIDSERYRGTCYLAANFKYIGETKGFGKHGNKFEFHGNKKKVFIYELDKHFIKSIAPHLQRTVRPALPEKTDFLESLIVEQGKTITYAKNILGSLGLTPENVSVLHEDMAKYLNQFRPSFNHMEQPKHFASYFLGLMSELPGKSMEPIALISGDSNNVRLMQHFITASNWNEDTMKSIHHDIFSANMSEDDGVFTIDGCDFAKKGHESVGVSRQYCGALGKTENCQASVMLGYNGSEGFGLIDARLYMPKIWHSKEYEDRRFKCRVPDDIAFQTKNEIAIDLLISAVNSGKFKGKWVAADSAFGHDHKFIDRIPKGLYYFVEVHSDDKFFVKMRDSKCHDAMVPSGKSGKEQMYLAPLRVSLIVEHCKTPWLNTMLAMGSKGPLAGEIKVMRVIDIRDGQPNSPIWLIARKKSDGSIKYSISNAPEDTPLKTFVKLAASRWSIEQSFEECKSYLGMDHFEGRSWRGWHRHILIVFIAYLFLQLMKRKYSLNNSDLPNKTLEINKDFHIKTAETTKVLTTNHLRQIFFNAVVGGAEGLRYALRIVDHNMRRYADAFFSKIKCFYKRFRSKMLTNNQQRKYMPPCI